MKAEAGAEFVFLRCFILCLTCVGSVSDFVYGSLSFAEDEAGLDYGLLGITRERVITKRNPSVAKSSIDVPKVKKHQISDLLLLTRKAYNQKVDPFDRHQPAVAGPSVTRPPVAETVVCGLRLQFSFLFFLYISTS